MIVSEVPSGLVIERTDSGEVAIVRIAHGPVNAMDLDLCRDITTTFRGLVADPAKAVVLTGSGHAFSAGVDLRRFLDGGEPYLREFLPALSEAFLAVFELAKPVVAALNGYAIAGGCVLACCADTTLMAEGDGRIGIPEIEVGVPFPRVALEVVRYAVGEVAARRLVLGAQTVTPDVAHVVGLVDRVVPAAQLEALAVAEARGMVAAVPPDTFALTKAQLRRDTMERVEAWADESAAVAELWARRATDGWTSEYLRRVTKR